MSVILEIKDLEGGKRLFKMQREKGRCSFVEWKREETLAKELGYEDSLEEIHSDWELDAGMMISMLKSYRDRGVERVDWKCRGEGLSIEEIIGDLTYELECSWDSWIDD